jgi:uncharacterized protein
VTVVITVSDIIRVLDLAPHPEGGFYRETFRDSVLIEGRAASTCIYFLLPEGGVSRWHRVDAVETWHWYGGAALELNVTPGSDFYSTQRLGPDLLAGERPQGVVPRGHWQQAASRKG